MQKKQKNITAGKEGNEDGTETVPELAGEDARATHVKARVTRG